jgi:hypothetical protein
MKRAKIGTSTIDTAAKVWTDGQRMLKNNIALQYAKINRYNAEYNIVSPDTAKAEELLNKMDIAYITIKAIEAYGEQPELLYRAGIVLGNMIGAGDFAKSYSSMDARNAALTKAFFALQNDVQNWQIWQMPNEQWAAQWESDVMQCNYYADPRRGITKTADPGNFAIGEVYDTAYYMERVYDAGSHWLYTAVSDVSKLDQLNKGIPAKVLRKRDRQIAQANYFVDANTGLEPYTVYDMAATGIIDKYGVTPDLAVATMQEGNGDQKRWDDMIAGKIPPQIGAFGIDDLLIIITVATAVLGLLGKALEAASAVLGVINQVKVYNQLKNAPSALEIEQAQAEAMDYKNYLEGMDNPVENFFAEVTDGVKALARKPITWAIIGGVILLKATK